MFFTQVRFKRIVKLFSSIKLRSSFKPHSFSKPTFSKKILFTANKPRLIAEKQSTIICSKFTTGFNGYKWGHNSPHMMSKIFHENCVFEREIMDEAFECPALNLTILPTKRGYAVNYKNVSKLFDTTQSENVLKMLEESYFVHFYSHLSNNFKATKNSTSAFVQLAKKSCPRVLESCGENF